MKEETLLFLDDLVGKNKKVFDVLTADHSFMDENVARIYGFPSENITGFQRIPTDENRRGLLTQPSILAINSAGDHSTPVLRGKWVLEKLMCSVPPPPPPNIPVLPVPTGGNLKGESKVRERMAQHRAMGGSCAACHKAMDPIGLSMENFDSLGHFRSTYTDGTPIDPSGVLPSGAAIANHTDLADAIVTDSRFPMCIASHLASFANGWSMLSAENQVEIKSIVGAALNENSKFADLIIEIVGSHSFQNCH